MKNIAENSWRYDGEIELVDFCALCESNCSEVDIDFSIRLGLIDPFLCRICPVCGLRWLSPRPTEKGYESIYTIDNYFGGEHSQESFSNVEKNREILFRDRLKRINLFFKGDKNKKILDIGAATGQFVYEAQVSGYYAIGIELSSEAIEQARKKYSVNLHKETLQQLVCEGNKFDIIHMNHVFEHFLSPAECLEQCRKLLNKNGLLIIEVPQQFYNSVDALKRLLKINKEPIFTPYSLHHTYFYTPKNLNMLLQKNGFSIYSLCTSNLANTPLWPVNFKNIFLSGYLSISNRLFKKGNIIEIFSVSTL